MKRGLAFAFFVWIAVLWAGMAIAAETPSIIKMDVSRDQSVTGRDFLLLPGPQQVALVWGITAGQEQAVQRTLGVLFHLRKRYPADFLDDLIGAVRTFPHGCNCTAKDGCKAIETRRATRDLVVDYLKDDELRKDQKIEHIVDLALADYCR
ncbi:MAG: hypothetical protein QF830_03695 [Rhodospirillales bacterium]|jgi:hypothetical protein|nr:hypothetical protein [Rhodospirillales bacterium]MDP6883219.1 hypothetical protein [Rhodospirillales bacterium]